MRLVLAAFCVALPLFAADVVRETPFYTRENGTMVPVDRIPAEVPITPLKATPDGKWLRVWWKERQGWIPARDVRGADLEALRKPAFDPEANTVSAEKNTLRVDVAFQSRKVGVGGAVNFFRRAPFLEFLADTRVDVGPALYYFPAANGGTLTEVFLLLRCLRPVLGKLEVGGDIGAVYHRYVADDPFGLGDNVENAFGAALGPMMTYQVASQFRVAMNIRVLLTTVSVTVQLATGLEFRF